MSYSLFYLQRLKTTEWMCFFLQLFTVSSTIVDMASSVTSSSANDVVQKWLGQFDTANA